MAEMIVNTMVLGLWRNLYLATQGWFSFATISSVSSTHLTVAVKEPHAWIVWAEADDDVAKSWDTNGVFDHRIVDLQLGWLIAPVGRVAQRIGALDLKVVEAGTGRGVTLLEDGKLVSMEMNDVMCCGCENTITFTLISCLTYLWIKNIHSL